MHWNMRQWTQEGVCGALFNLLETWELLKEEARGIWLHHVGHSTQVPFVLRHLHFLSEGSLFLNYFHILRYCRCETICERFKVKVWERINMSSEAFRQMEVFCDLFNQKADALSKQGNWLSITNTLPYTLGSIVWLYEVYRVTYSLWVSNFLYKLICVQR